MLDRISSVELTEWMCFSELEPFGADAYYLGPAIVAQTVANVNREKGKKAYKTEDFMPKFGESEPQSADQMMQFAQMMTVALGGEDKRGR